MRDLLAAPSADRMSSATSWMAWGLAGAFFTLVALPLASSSPYPTPSRQDWSIPQSQATTFSLASASSVQGSTGDESVPLVTTVKTLSIKRPIGNGSEPDADHTIVAASISDPPTADAANEPKLTSAPSTTDDEDDEDEAAPAGSRATPSVSEIDAYLWKVYQRQPLKKDRGGDFSWKDPAAAKRMGKTLQSYVILGMEADFRELVYHAGRAMDADGIEWHIVSGFRDDWRQSIATGVKARTGYSRHGGSRAVGGYGHGRAIDIGHIDRDKNEDVWRWIDDNGAKYGLHRPFRSFDPPHVEPRVEWRRVASRLRQERTGIAVAEDVTGTVEAREPVEETRPVRRKARAAVSNRRSARGRQANHRATRGRVVTVKANNRGTRGRAATVKRRNVAARSAKAKHEKRRRVAARSAKAKQEKRRRVAAR
ncbi:MAG: hypothetical protein GEU95_20430 [Rhizobiales bacterium]|nr:hypothetical protein [Hyphomicrobiales bacterium]